MYKTALRYKLKYGETQALAIHGWPQAVRVGEANPLVITIYVFIKDIGFEIRSQQMRKNNRWTSRRYSTSTGTITDVDADKGYKYLGVQLTNENMQNMM